MFGASQAITWTPSGCPMPFKMPDTSARAWDSIASDMLPEVSTTTATDGIGCRREGRTTFPLPTCPCRRDGLR